jgi:NhaA family Na+:H+ antiporter
MEARHQTWATSDRFVPRTFIRPFVKFSQLEASSGIAILVAALIALIIANSPWSETYFSVLEEHLHITFFGWEFEISVLHFINDALMTLFFFVVGLEIKREAVLGDLRDPKAAALPVIAALGGMIVPAVIYTLFNGGTDAASGWGIPMATDIAFAVGVVTLLGKRVPAAAKLFLLAVAVADDIGAIAVIAIFYTGDVRFNYLIGALIGLFLVWLAGRAHIRSMAFYVPVAVVIWYFAYRSGVHATLTGVALGFLTPARPYYRPKEFDRRARAILDPFRVDDETSEEEAIEHAEHEIRLLSEISRETIAPLNRLEHRLAPWSSFLVVPLFALANAGVDFRGVNVLDSFTSKVALGVAIGLLVGKTIGISLFSWLAVRIGLGRLPGEVSWRHIVGLAAVGGIGFTVALFVTGLAFDDPATTDLAKTGIFAGSLVAGVLGAMVLRMAGGKTES